MTKRTRTSKIRHYAVDKATGTLVKRDVPLPAQPRELVTCACGRSKYLSVGQIWKCKHENSPTRS